MAPGRWIWRTTRARSCSPAGPGRLRRLGVALPRMKPIDNLSAVEAGVAKEQARLELVLAHGHQVVLEQKRIASSVVTAHTDTGLTATLTVNPTET